MNQIEFVKAAKWIVFIALGWYLGGSLFAQTSAEPTVIRPPTAVDQPDNVEPIVREIRIEFAGPRTVDRSVIVSNMRTTVGQPFSQLAIENDVKNLYATGFFTNLRIQTEPVVDGVRVIVVAQAKPVIREIIFRGNEGLKDRALLRKLDFKVGDTLSEAAVALGAKAIRDFYREKAWFEAEVDFRLDENKFGRTTVIYTIKEGRRSWVTQIDFEGVTAFEPDELRKVMKTRRKDWFSWLNRSGVFDPNQFEKDKQAVLAKFNNAGFIDARIDDVVMTFAGEKDREIHLTLKIFEGVSYKVGSVSFEGNAIASQDQLRAVLSMLEGAVFSPAALLRDTDELQKVYGRMGHLDAQVVSERKANIETATIDVHYRISEGSQSFVERVIIEGNNRTRDKVLRRELALAPGDVYDTVRADASKKRLENLGYFDAVDIKYRDTEVSNRKDMIIRVTEKRTGSITFGAGFSTVDSLLGFVELSQSNFDITKFPTFTGAGQKFRMRLQYGLSRRDALISFTEPWFLDQRLSVGTDWFFNESDFLSSVYNQRRYGASFRVARALNDFWTISGKYTFENIGIFDVANDASQAIKDEAGSRTKSSMVVALTYESRDNLFAPTRGEKVEFTFEGAGGPLMGDTNLWRFQVDAIKFWPLPWDLVFSLAGSTGVVDRYGDTSRVPLFDRFFIGGSRTIRGFDFREVGPLDNNGDPIGGSTMAYTQAELTFPIYTNVRGAVFFDSGFNNAKVFDYSLSDVHAGVGVGLRLNLPIGPLRLDLGFPVIHNSFNDDTMNFHFDAGYQF